MNKEQNPMIVPALEEIKESDRDLVVVHAK